MYVSTRFAFGISSINFAGLFVVIESCCRRMWSNRENRRLLREVGKAIDCGAKCIRIFMRFLS